MVSTVDGRQMIGKAILTVLAVALAACGSTTTLPEAPGTTPLTAASVVVKQTGNGNATVDKNSVTFMLDNAGALVMHLNLKSNASKSQTFAVQATLFDPAGTIIGNASGGDVGISAGSTTPIQLNGQTPNGTISAVTIEVTAVASPTPT